MELVNFKIDPDNIGILLDEEYFDLHNCADLTGFSYSVRNHHFKMTWRKNTGDWVEKSFPKELSISFNNVKSLKIKERDPDVPFSEDNCISYFGFHPNEMFEDLELLQVPESHNFKLNSHLVFNFQSEASIRLIAKSAVLEVVR